MNRELDDKIVRLLNDQLLSQFNFDVELTPQGYNYRDCRKPKPVNLNGDRPLKTLDEVLNFIGVAIRKLYIREANTYRLLRKPLTKPIKP